MPIKCPSSLEDFGGNGRFEQTLWASSRSAQRRKIKESKKEVKKAPLKKLAWGSLARRRFPARGYLTYFRPPSFSFPVEAPQGRIDQASPGA